jgi:hypothetical protein
MTEQYGSYMIWVEGYGTVGIPCTSRNFKDLFSLVGPIRGGPRKVQVLPGEWIDAETFHLK